MLLMVAGTAGAARGSKPAHDSDASATCVACHTDATQGIVEQWHESGHARAGVGCVKCHRAAAGEPDAFDHYGTLIASVVTPRDCGTCHAREAREFAASHHAAAGNILASLDNRLAEVVEGCRTPFAPHAATPPRDAAPVDGMASATSGCRQCHGGKVGLRAVSGGVVTVDDLKPDAAGRPTVPAAAARIERDAEGRPSFDAASWPNTGIGRLNLDGSKGSCTACHSRHDFSARRARQPENCGKCHMGPDHPQKEIYGESKHGVAYLDLRDRMKMDAHPWILGTTYTQAPTCATCHMSGHAGNGGRVTHDPGERISWTNRPPVSLVMDTDAGHAVVTEPDPVKRAALVADSWQAKRDRMKGVCLNCHAPAYVDAFYLQYDALVTLYDEKFARAGIEIMGALRAAHLLTPAEFDEPIEWTWYMLWHHEGRRARHGAAMMGPDYTHWHGMYEVADRFYVHLVPEARALARQAADDGRKDQARAVNAVIDGVLARPEHAWQGAPRAE
jgi:hypothetical protein